MSSIRINTGLKVYDIEDENGNIRGQISFNPADVNFFPRAQAMYDNVMHLIEDIEQLPEDIDEKELVDKLTEYDLAIKKEVDILFDDETASKVVFGNQNCFNTLNGESFIERFLNAFMPVIKKEFEEENKKSVERINKYTSQVK